MLTPVYTNKFKKDFYKKIKAGKDKEKLLTAAKKLIEQQPLEGKYKDHKLKGKLKDRRECHIEPDWLLLYKIDGDRIIFERTGSHAELFE